MIEQYRIKKEIPRHFIKLLPKQCPAIQAGEICRYFPHNDVYLFDARKGYIPYIERKYVELWNELFEPLPGDPPPTGRQGQTGDLKGENNGIGKY